MAVTARGLRRAGGLALLAAAGSVLFLLRPEVASAGTELEALVGRTAAELVELRTYALRLRAGLAHRWSELVVRERLIGELDDALESAVAALPQRSARTLEAPLKRYREVAKRRRALFAALPVESQKLERARSSIAVAFRDLAAAASAEPALANEFALASQLYHSALAAYALEDPIAAEQLSSLARACAELHHLPGAAELAGLARDLVRLDDAVDSALASMIHLPSLAHLEEIESAIGAQIRAERDAAEERWRLFYALGAALVLAVGGLLTFDVLRDNRRLELQIAERERAAAAARRSELELLGSRRLETVGQLASGVAHELDTPTQFASDNVRFLRDAFGELQKWLELAGRIADPSVPEADRQQLVEDLVDGIQVGELDFIAVEVPEALDEALGGLERVASIVTAMHSFARPDGAEVASVDLNAALRDTVTVSRSEWKLAAEVVLELEEALPRIEGYAGELNQVFLNLLVNAAHAIQEAVDTTTGEKGTITVRTRSEGDAVVVEVADDGVGIRAEIRERVFEPFFTTKEAGKGSGQGLAISRAIVVERHGGTIAVEARPGRGSTFVVRLPLNSALSRAG